MICAGIILSVSKNIKLPIDESIVLLIKGNNIFVSGPEKAELESSKLGFWTSLDPPLPWHGICQLSGKQELAVDPCLFV